MLPCNCVHFLHQDFCTSQMKVPVEEAHIFHVQDFRLILVIMEHKEQNAKLMLIHYLYTDFSENLLICNSNCSKVIDILKFTLTDAV